MTIEKQIDESTLERWRFSFINGMLLLDEYYLLKRYDRLMSRNNTITESEVPLTDELKAEALNKFVSKIKVLKWSEM